MVPDRQGESASTSAGAEAAFASYLARVNAGEAVDFEEFCSDRPDQAESLLRLHAAWRAERPQTIREFLNANVGRDVNPNVSLDGDVSGSSSGVRERLLQLAGRTGRYTLREEVARGGMGVILKVWDEDLRRNLAMKTTIDSIKTMTETGAPSTAVDQVSRFLEEAQITGQLDHPGIVPVHELGIDDEGRMFFTMRLVKGRTLDEVIKLARADQDGWNRPRALNLMVRVCEALAYAHSKGVIHRDIKPANIMVGKFGEVYVMDWGLAKVLGRVDTHTHRLDASVSFLRTMIRTDRRDDLLHTPDSAMVTMEGTVIGTPAYMPPEQAEGRIDALDPRSDVYSVGALLYTLLTGWMPYVNPDEPPSLAGVLNHLMAGPPKPIDEIEGDVPPELVAICEKAMARRPAERYATMIEMADDLRAYVERRVVRAYRTGAVAEFRKWVHRNKATAAACAALLLLTVGGSVAVMLLQQQKVSQVRAAQELTDQARTRAEANERAALASANEASVQAARAERQSYSANVAAAHASLRMHETREAKQLLAACPEKLRGWEWHHLRLATDTSLRTLLAHQDKVTAVAFSPDGTRIASGSEDKSLRIWDSATGEELFALPGLSDSVTALAFSPRGDRVAAASTDMLVRVWDANMVRLLDTLSGQESVVTCLAFSRDGKRIAAGADEGARVWDVDSSATLAVLEHDEPVHAIAFAPDDARLVTGTDTGVHVWHGGKLARTIDVEEGVTCVAYGPGGIAAGSHDALVRVFDPATGATRQVLSGHADPVSSVAFLPGDEGLLSGSLDKTVRVWDLGSGAVRSVLQGHDGAVLAVDGARDGTRIVSGSADGTARLWQTKGGEAALTLHGDEDFLAAVAFDPSGERVAAASAGHGEVRIWDAETGRELLYVPERGGGLSSLAFSADGAWLVTGGEGDATARIVDAGTGELLRTLEGHDASVSAVAISPDRTRVATGSADATVRIWDASSGREVRVLEGHTQRVGAVAFSPDGRRLLTASHDGTARLWEVESGQLQRVFEQHEGPVLAAIFDPRGERCVTAGMDTTIRIWNARSGEQVFVLPGHAGAVSALAFDRDGTRLVSGGRDKTVRVWDAATAGALLRLLAHDHWVTSVTFSPDGTRIASCSWDTTAKVWRTE
ncbi:MAG: protein kinase domain-containing protein [Planctomycetota bacterium]|jgi:WD40 repeat protein/serine/threonine protein kinase